MVMKGRANISVIPNQWLEFKKICEEIDSNKSDTIQELISKFISEHKKEKKFGDKK